MTSVRLPHALRPSISTVDHRLLPPAFWEYNRWQGPDKTSHGTGGISLNFQNNGAPQPA